MIILCQRWNAFLYIFSIHRKAVSVIKKKPFQNPKSGKILLDFLQKVPLHSTILSIMLSAKWKCSFFLFLKVLYFNESNLYVK